MQYNESEALGGMVVIVEERDTAANVISFAEHIGATSLQGVEVVLYHIRLPGGTDKLYTEEEIRALAERNWQ